MKSLVFDIETDGLQPTKIFCISAFDTDTQEQFNFSPFYIDDGIELLKSADKLIGHNIIGFDIPVVKRLCNVDLIDKTLVDTLVLSRLFNPVRGSHSLESWGYKLQFPKIEFHDYRVYYRKR
jgi:DNA polymerase-1